MTCIIHWNSLSLSDWHARFKRIRRSNLLQSVDYGMAMRGYRGQSPRWGVIEMNGQDAGMVQILEVTLAGGLMHAVILDRGPLWFEGYGSTAHYRAFLACFAREFPARIGRMRRFIPEIEDADMTRSLLKEAGFKASGRAKPYETLWLDLSKDSETLRAGLHKKWRNALAKAERSALTVEWDMHRAHLPWLLSEYHFDRIAKNYPGPPVKLLKALAAQSGPAGNMLIGRALVRGEAVGGVLIFMHGQSATYQTGFTNKEGRAVNAHNLLLWRAALMLQEKGITDLDLGGINEDADGIRLFKSGMGSDPVRLPGLYR